MTSLRWLSVLLLACVLAGALRSEPHGVPPGEGPGSSSAESDPLHTARVERMVRDAHQALAGWQNADGSFSLPRRDHGRAAPVAVTGLAALSLMAHGHLPDRGNDELSRAVRRAVQWLVEHCQDGGEESGYFRHDGDSVSKMHGQGYALLALTQAAGAWGDRASDREELDGAIRRGVDLVQRTQGLQGGWYYEPRASAAHEGSITVCMIQALRAAKDAGYEVDPAVIEKAVGYIRKSQDPESGRFRYQIGSETTSWALTAAALSTLNATGSYDSEILRDGHDALERADIWLQRRHENFQWYGSFYAAQAYWVHPDRRRFERWWDHFVDACENERGVDGSFPDGTYGRVYATAMVSLSLQVPFGMLPLFQR
ncbi:MAG: hypothetical protein DHS20C15_10840 [Planctomycetota bacterium]|nr:MAG: hypothetical protein DHS20C15_10840 [Planctomycetota bacterium]